MLITSRKRETEREIKKEREGTKENEREREKGDPLDPSVHTLFYLRVTVKRVLKAEVQRERPRQGEMERVQETDTETQHRLEGKRVLCNRRML